MGRRIPCGIPIGPHRPMAVMAMSIGVLSEPMCVCCHSLKLLSVSSSTVQIMHLVHKHAPRNEAYVHTTFDASLFGLGSTTYVMRLPAALTSALASTEV